MFSDALKAALDREVKGQPRAVNTVVRGITRVVSQLTPREKSFCTYLLIGPPGTGKTHLIRSVARIVNGTDRSLITVNCGQTERQDPWSSVLAQLAPLAARQLEPQEWSGTKPTPNVVRIEYLERGPRELADSLANALETGQILLPGGAPLELRDSLIFLTTGLCSREILEETSPIGFAGSQDADVEDGEQGRIYATCLEQTQERFGRDLIGLLDGLIVFHRLEPEHLTDILERRVERLNEWLYQRGLACELNTAAKQFLLQRASHDLRCGARELMRVHQKFVEFPLADLLVSRRVPPGGRVIVERRSKEDHLHFTVEGPAAQGADAVSSYREVPITWQAAGGA